MWLGPCIGPRQFEVGADVREAFAASMPGAAVSEAFVPRGPGPGPAKWLADLPQLARLRLAAQGARAITGGAWCTVEGASRFFSFRRDRVTGRMVACVWREHG